MTIRTKDHVFKFADGNKFKSLIQVPTNQKVDYIWWL